MSGAPNPFSTDGLGMLGFAVVFLTLFGLASSSVWKSWHGDPRVGSVMITGAPMAGFPILGFWLDGVLPPSVSEPVGMIGFLLGLVFLPTIFYEPTWYGPRWYREKRRRDKEPLRACRERKRRRREGNP